MTTIAILGGGQLGAYLCQAAVPLELKTRVLSVARDEPVWALADLCVEGPLDSVKHVLEVAEQADVLTYEIEAIGPACLEALAREAVVVRPDSGILLTLQNKIKQREFYAAHKFASPLWTALTDVTHAHFEALVDELGVPFVQKAATGGYDGRGVQAVRQREDLRLDFGASLFEALVPIRTELGMLVARSATGECKVYPPVEMRFHEDKLARDASRPRIVSGAYGGWSHLGRVNADTDGNLPPASKQPTCRSTFGHGLRHLLHQEGQAEGCFRFN